MKAGAHHVAGEQRHVAAHAIGDASQHEVGARHERHVGLRALQRAEPGTVPERARLHAAVIGALQTEEAVPAGSLKAAEHTITNRHPRHRVTNREHLADVLVADREAGLDLHAAVVDVQVRAAHAGRLDAYDRVLRVEQLGVRAILDADDARGLECDGAHVAPAYRAVADLARRGRTRGGGGGGGGGATIASRSSIPWPIPAVRTSMSGAPS